MRRIDVASSSIGTGLSEVMKSWTEIKKNIDTYNARTSFETHTSLLNRITEILPAAAEASGLTTDPDIDANYVGKVMTLRVPATFKALGMFRSNGFQVLNRHSLSPEERIELNILNDRYTKEYQTLLANWTRVETVNSALATALETKLNDVRKAAEYFKGPQVLALLSGDLSLAPAELFNHATASMESLFALFDASAVELDGLLAARLRHHQMSLYLTLGGVGAVLVLVLYLFGGMLLSVLRSLKSIEAGAERLARGDVSQAVDSYSRDELREVGGAVNSVVETLGKFIKAQLDMARAHNQDGRVSHEMRANEFTGAYGDMARQFERDGESPYRSADAVCGFDGRLRQWPLRSPHGGPAGRTQENLRHRGPAARRAAEGAGSRQGNAENQNRAR
jgi:methyl-accepting chemotaxis protein